MKCPQIGVVDPHCNFADESCPVHGITGRKTAVKVNPNRTKTYKVVLLSGDSVTVEADVLNVDEQNNLRFGVAELTPAGGALKITRVFAAGQWVHVKAEKDA